MKRIVLVLVLVAAALPAIAQDPAPTPPATPAKPADAAPTTPATPAAATTPAAPGTKAPQKAEPPPLPEPLPGTSESDLTKGQPGPRLRPNPEPSLLPDNITRGSGERGPRRTTLKPPTTSADLDRRIRYRQARTRAAATPALAALWEESRTVTTDYEKRDALKRYYTGLFKAMVAFDKTIAPLVEERKKFAMFRLEQSRIDPTDPLDEDHRLRRE